MADASNFAAYISASAPDEHRWPGRRVRACVAGVDSCRESATAPAYEIELLTMDDLPLVTASGLSLVGGRQWTQAVSADRHVAVDSWGVGIGFVYCAGTSCLVAREC